MSTLLVIALIVFVILGIVASLGGNAGQYERIGESWLEPRGGERAEDSAGQDGDELL